MNEQERLNFYIKEFKKAYTKGKLSLEDSHDYALRTTYLKIQKEKNEI